MRLSTILLVTAVFALTAACGPSGDGGQAPVSGIELAYRDTAVRPQDDFYEYVNGGWLATAEIPADRTSIGVFNDLREQSRKDVLAIITDLANSSDLKPGGDERKVADFYRAYMDSARLDALGVEPLAEEFRRVAAIADRTMLAAYFARASMLGIRNPLRPYVRIDSKDATRYAFHIRQSGLGLPDRDYYFKEDERHVGLRRGYVAHITRMFELAGLDDPAGSAEVVMALETLLAGSQWTRVENRDRDRTYNKMTTAELVELAPEMEWMVYMRAGGFHREKDLIVGQPPYLTAFAKAFRDISLEDWKTYLTWHVLNAYAGDLSEALARQDYEFYSKQLNGQQEMEPRWKRGVDGVNRNLGQIVGKIYVNRHFRPEAKARMVELVENLRGAYARAIEDLEWMSAETKEAALAKLAKFHPKVGYPDRWDDYSALEIQAGDHVGNLMRSRLFDFDLDRSKLGGPIRKYEWGMNPQTVNAYYNPSLNEIVFPAAILQPPFFNLAADDAVNYGAIGAVIGHEMGHGFDDQGSKYDADGNMKNWWTDSDREEFKKRTESLVAQYDRFELYEDLNVSGELTLGENIGDLAGLTIAYRAYQTSLDGKEAPVIDGLTGQQRFFMGIGQVWRSKYTEEAMRNRAVTDVHSPARFRVDGPLANMAEFVDAFDVKEGDGMYLPPDQRVKIW